MVFGDDETVQQSYIAAEQSCRFLPNYMQRYYQVQSQPRSYYHPYQPPPSYLAQMMDRHYNAQGTNQGNVIEQQYLHSEVLSNQPAQHMVKPIAETFHQISKASKKKQQPENVSPNGTQRQARANITESQRCILAAMYSQKQFPSNKERRALGEKTGLNPRQVQVWFQNVRSKDKKVRKIIPKVKTSDVIEMDASVEDALNYFEQL